MPFYKEWDETTRTKIPNRDQTGPPPPPETGTTVQADGTVAVANQETQPYVPPPTPVKVSFPGPNEPIVGRNGLITPRWWRFLDELYRRTGGPVDNINRAPTRTLGDSTTDALVLAGSAPTVVISEVEAPTVATVAITGYAPTVA